MKQAFTLLLIFTAFVANAQVQFWNTIDIENEQWMPFYKTGKVKRVTVYQIDESGKQIHNNDPKTVSSYDVNTRPVAVSSFKYNWKNLKNELLHTDSLFYNDKGQLIRFSSYDGIGRQKNSEIRFVYDAKGRQIRQDKYGMQNYELVKEGTDQFTYVGERPVKLVSKNTDKILDDSRQFSYDKQGRLTRAILTTDGNSIVTNFTWNEKNELTGYKEINGNKLTSEVSFIYDDVSRRISSHIALPGGYSSTTTYIYKGKEMLPYVSHTTYPGSGGKNDLRFENMEMEYEFY